MSASTLPVLHADSYSFERKLMRNNVATIGAAPLHKDIYLGADGQLWKWDNGQRVVARSGQDAIDYATEHGWPERKILLVRSAARVIAVGNNITSWKSSNTS